MLIVNELNSPQGRHSGAKTDREEESKREEEEVVSGRTAVERREKEKEVWGEGENK